MTKQQFINRLTKTLFSIKEDLIRHNNIWCDKIRQKGQNKTILEKYNFTAGEISMINMILNYINLIEKEN